MGHIPPELLDDDSSIARCRAKGELRSERVGLSEPKRWHKFAGRPEFAGRPPGAARAARTRRMSPDSAYYRYTAPCGRGRNRARKRMALLFLLGRSVDALHSRNVSGCSSPSPGVYTLLHWRQWRGNSNSNPRTTAGNSQRGHITYCAAITSSPSETQAYEPAERARSPGMNASLPQPPRNARGAISYCSQAALPESAASSCGIESDRYPYRSQHSYLAMRRSTLPASTYRRFGQDTRIRGPLSETALVLRRSSNDGLRWVAWANLFARAYPIADTGKLSLAHATLKSGATAR